MSEYVLSVDADLDLDDIWRYIAADSIDAVDRWIEGRSTRSMRSGALRALGTSEKT